MIRILPSDPAFAEIDRVARSIAALTNPALHWDLRQMDEAIRLATLAELREMFEELAR